MSARGSRNAPAAGLRRAGEGVGRGTPGRLAVMVVLAALVAGGVVLERRAPDAASARVAGGAEAESGVPRVDAVSTAWYCAAGTAAADGSADETVDIANLSTDEIQATLTVYPGGQEESRTRVLRLGGYERVRARVAEELATANPGVVVEVFGGPAIVEHELSGSGDLAMGPCAREPSPRWYFAAGTTARGSTQVLALFNPFGDDAIVDIAFVTDGGVQEPQEVQGFVVPRRSKVVVPVQDLVPRQDRVATSIVARTGRIVAEQVQSFDGTDGRYGLAVSLGALDTGRGWTVPFGEAGTDVTSTVAIANLGLTPTSVEVSLALPGVGVLAPEVVDVPSRSVVDVDAGARVPPGSGYGVVARVQGDEPVVAEGFLFEGGAAGARGAAAGTGTAGAARRWALAGSPPETSSVVTAVNRGNRPVTVELRAYTQGDPDSPRSAPALVVEPGKQARFDLDELGVANQQVLVVDADGPVVVGREVYVGGVSLSLAVPFRS